MHLIETHQVGVHDVVVVVVVAIIVHSQEEELLHLMEQLLLDHHPTASATATTTSSSMDDGRWKTAQENGRNECFFETSCTYGQDATCPKVLPSMVQCGSSSLRLQAPVTHSKQSWLVSIQIVVESK